MLYNYLKIAFRNLKRNKAFTIINITSLAIGMGVSLAICQYVFFELSHDRFNKNHANTYRVILKGIKSETETLDPYTGYGLAVKATEDLPEIQDFVRMHKYGPDLAVTNPANHTVFHVSSQDMFFVDESFFKVFNYPFKLGNAKDVFSELMTVVITEKTAKRYFGNDNPIGKTLRIDGQPSPGTYVVTGVLEDLPSNSHLQFDFLLPMKNYLELGWWGSVTEDDKGWDSPFYATYLVLESKADLGLVTSKLDELLADHNVERYRSEGLTEKVILQPIADIHLKSEDYANEGFAKGKGSYQNVRIFQLVAVLILIVGWINYINLSTAQAMRRGKEVSIRKSIGAHRKQLIGQFLTESLLVNLLSVLLAFALATVVMLPLLSEVLGVALTWDLFQLPVFWVISGGVVFTGSFLSGLYPAFVLSSFSPVKSATTQSKVGNVGLRKSLVLFQFVISLMMIAGTMLAYRQVTFMKTREMGMNLDQTLVIKGPKVDIDWDKMRGKVEAFKTEVTRHPSILAATGSSNVPGKGYGTGVERIRKLGDPVTAGSYGREIYGGVGFVEAYDLDLIAGESFSSELRNEEPVVVLNEEAIKQFGFDNPHESIGQKIIYTDYEDTFKVIGVVENFHWHSLKEKHVPYVLAFFGASHEYLSLRLAPKNINASLRHIEQVFGSFFPGNPLDFFFLEEEFNRQYQSDLQFGSLFLALTVLAILIACIGLFAMISYSATTRVKEIGIRKILGADIHQVMFIFSKEYMVLLLVANLLAIPLIYSWGTHWLSDYAFRMNLSLEIFLIPGILLSCICGLTIGYRIYKTARANPVNALRSD